MEKEDIKQTMKFRPWVKKVAIGAGILIALIICYNVMLGRNTATQLLVKQSIDRPTKLNEKYSIQDFGHDRPPQSWCYTSRKLTTWARYFEDKNLK